jgi:hypothetical protein
MPRTSQLISPVCHFLLLSTLQLVHACIPVADAQRAGFENAFVEYHKERDPKKRGDKFWREEAKQYLVGCQVHYKRQVQRVSKTKAVPAGTFV